MVKKMIQFKRGLLVLLLWALTACQSTAVAPTPTATFPSPTVTSQPATLSPQLPPADPQLPAPIYSYQIVQTYPHDPTAFTQGLLWHDGNLYESTGWYGYADVRRVALETGEVQQITVQDRMEPPFFGEGLALWNGRLWLLTWQAQTGFIYDQQTLESNGRFTYTGEGWGLTQDGNRFIRSNGTNTLTFHDPTNFAELGSITVTDAGVPVARLNELEFIEGEVWANVWQTDRIARIDPASGAVLAWIDLTGLRPPETLADHDAVLNGIAYDAANGRIFVTGKRWPNLYEIMLAPGLE